MGSAGDVRGGGAFLELYTVSSGLTTGLNRVRGDVLRWASALAASVTTIMAPISALKNFADYGDNAAKSAKRLRVNVEELQAMRHTADLAGMSNEKFDGSLMRITKGAAEAATGNKEFVETFKSLKINVNEFMQMNLIQKLNALKEGFAQLAPAMQLDAAFKLMRYEGAQFINVLEAGNFERYAAEAKMLGLVLGGDVASRAEVLSDSIQRLQGALKGLSLAFGAAISEDAINLINWMTAFTVATREAATSSPEMVASLMMIGKFGLILAAIFGVVALAATGVLVPFLLVAVAVVAIVEAFGLVDTGAADLFKSIKVGGQSLHGWWTWFGDELVNIMLVVWDDIKLGLGGLVDFFKNSIDRILIYYMKARDMIGLGKDEYWSEIKKREDNIANRWSAREQQHAGNMERESQRKAASKTRLEEDAASTATNPLKNFFNRMRDIKSFLEMPEAGGPSPDMPFGGPLPGIPTKLGVKGFFGGSFGAEQLGEAYAGGSSFEERQLSKLDSIDNSLRQVADNTKSNRIPTFQGD
jgi:hypothetical protein